MPYIVLGFGILLGVFAFYRFMVRASVDEVRTFFRIAAIVVYVIVMLGFALFGRVAISIGLLLLCVPFVIGHYRAKMKSKPDQNNKKSDDHNDAAQ